MALVTQKLVKFLGFNIFIMETLKSYEFEFKQVISNRIAHCNGQLKNNEVIAEDDNFFFFKNGELWEDNSRDKKAFYFATESLLVAK